MGAGGNGGRSRLRSLDAVLRARSAVWISCSRCCFVEARKAFASSPACSRVSSAEDTVADGVSTLSLDLLEDEELNGHTMVNCWGKGRKERRS